jgi:TPR repeat protein
MIKKLVLTLSTALLLGSVWADAREDADAANFRRDYAAEISITRPLAEKGEAWAQYNLGLMYSNGQGVVQDNKEAVKWYRLAAAQGLAKAQYNLGFMFENGLGVVQDAKEAVKWYRLAAAQGDASAQFNLGNMYYNGQGVVQDFTKAHMWFNLGGAQGNERSIENRNLTAAKMNPQQIAKAQKMAQDCLARNYQKCD